MDDLDRDFRFLTASARRSVEAATSAVRTTSRVRRSKRGAALSAHVLETLEAISSRITASVTRFDGASNDIERTASIETMRLVNGFLSQMQEATPWIQAGADPDLELGALYVIDGAADAIVGTPCDVVAFGDATYQYATVSWPFRSILTKLGQQPTPGPRPVVIFHPPADVNAFFLHPLFAHELGHSAVLNHGLVQSILATKAGDATWAAEHGAAVADAAARLAGGDNNVGRVILNRQLKRWLTELVCDDFGAHYAGPAYLFAFAAEVVAFSWNEPQVTHPPTTTRVDFLLKELDDLGWTPLLQAAVPGVLAWMRYVGSAQSAVTNTPYEDFLISAAEALRPAIRAAVANVLGADTYRPADYTTASDEVAELLRDRVLPAQLRSGDPVDVRTIQTAGWLHVLSNQHAPGSEGDDSTSISAGIANSELQMFLSKACEMSRVLDVWGAA